MFFKAHIPPEIPRLHWLPNVNEIYTKQLEINMAHASPNARPNATHMPLASVGSRNRSGRVGVVSARVCGYQNVGIGNLNRSRGVLCSGGI